MKRKRYDPEILVSLQTLRRDGIGDSLEPDAAYGDLIYRGSLIAQPEGFTLARRCSVNEWEQGAVVDGCDVDVLDAAIAAEEAKRRAWEEERVERAVERREQHVQEVQAQQRERRQRVARILANLDGAWIERDDWVDYRQRDGWTRCRKERMCEGGFVIWPSEQ